MLLMGHLTMADWGQTKGLTKFTKRPSAWSTSVGPQVLFLLLALCTHGESRLIRFQKLYVLFTSIVNINKGSPFGLVPRVLGHVFTYFWDPGNGAPMKNQTD